MTITDSTISNNSTSGFSAAGGGIFSETNLVDQTAAITNSTIYGNTVEDGAGGGIYNDLGLLQVFNSTIAGNVATVGGGISSGGDAFTETQLSSTIVAGNTATDGNDVSAEYASNTTNSFVSLGNNLIGDGQVGAETFFDPTNTDDDIVGTTALRIACLLYTSPSPRDLSTSRMPSSA